jgi:hypothetical protein
LYLQPGMKLLLVGILVVMVVIGVTLTGWPLLKPGPKAPPLPFGLIWVVIAVVYLLYFLSLPHRITFAEDGTVEFISLLRRRTVRAEEIQSIKPAGSQFGFFMVRTGQGKIRLLAQFDGFHDFLTRLQARNPGVELRGC